MTAARGARPGGPGIDRRTLVASGLGWAVSGGPAPAGEDLPKFDRIAGSLVMMGFRGADPEAAGARLIAGHIAAGRIGGVILFEDNFASPAAARALIGAFRQAAGGAKILVGVDQEGGAVSRLRPDRGFRSLPSAKATGRLPAEEASRLYEATAAELHGLGINVNFAPVVDLDVNPANPIIGALDRSFGPDPERVIERARLFIDAHRRNHVLTALKHFPGHGSSTEDSHRSLPDITRTYQAVEEQPFAALANQGYADMIMVGHLMHAGLTEPGRPASLSRRAIQGRLRQAIGFDGVVVSDDMQMGALRRFFTPDESIRLGLDAGLDLFVFSNREHPDPRMPGRFHEVVRDGLAKGTITPARIIASRDRIDALKRSIA